jgi:hypothetical protein
MLRREAMSDIASTWTGSVGAPRITRVSSTDQGFGGRNCRVGIDLAHVALLHVALSTPTYGGWELVVSDARPCVSGAGVRPRQPTSTVRTCPFGGCVEGKLPGDRPENRREATPGHLASRLLRVKDTRPPASRWAVGGIRPSGAAANQRVGFRIGQQPHPRERPANRVWAVPSGSKRSALPRVFVPMGSSLVLAVTTGRAGCLRHGLWRHRRAWRSCRGRRVGWARLRSRRPWSV